ncbi:MAG: hypothetical protein IT210_07770 [Armatimonadetes bacterium]|nr:hypothetical protein [Armatimonadota bacterium]
MEKLPLDGASIVVAIDPGRPTSGNGASENLLGWNLFGQKKFAVRDFAGAIADLKSAKWRRFTDNFMVAVISSSAQDQGLTWFDDLRWKAILNNWQVMVSIAKQGGCKGILLDPEHYGFKLFSFIEQQQRYPGSFEGYVAKARQRGRDLMAATRRIFPDITIMTLHGYGLAWSRVRPSLFQRKSLAQVDYSLLPAFLDGMIEAASPQAVIVDGYENAYEFKSRSHFVSARDTVKRQAKSLSRVPSTYAKRLQIGFGLWLDYGGAKRWDITDLTKNYFSPDEFARVLKAALEESDRYVWIYTQTPRFFPPSNLPDAYLKAIAEVRRSP